MMNFFHGLLGSVYLRSSCNCGPYLDPHKIKELPDVVGPGEINRILRSAVQNLINSALNVKDTFAILKNRQGNGDFIVQGKSFVTLTSDSVMR